MKKRWIIPFVIVAVIILPIVFSKINKTINRAEPVSMAILNDSQMEKTIMSPYLERQIINGTNLLYCSTFQLCWNEMKNLVNGDINLSGNPDMVTFLNKSLSTKNDISEKSYVAVAGYKKENIEDTINSQLKSKFNNAQYVNFDDMSEDDIIAYAYLYKNLKFNEEFESLKTPLYFQEGDNTIAVNAFGINDYSSKNEDMGKQVEIIDYQNEDDFIISLISSPEDDIVLVKVKPENTLMETIDSVNNRINSGQKEHLIENDILKIPKFSFKLTHQYSEIIDKYIMNPGFSHYQIAEAMQDITFVLDERGAILESRSLLTASKSVDTSRYLVFDKPFLLYMKEKGAKYPYFAIWIENAELMSIQQQK
jgi:hypothetical protein